MAHPQRERTPVWGYILMVVAAAMLVGLVAVVLSHRPGPERHARWTDDECDVLAKIVNCTPSSPRVEYALMRR